jgi:hypothetical protein
MWRIGGGLIDIDIRVPLYIMIAVTPLDFAFIAQTWRNPGIRRLTRGPAVS